MVKTIIASFDGYPSAVKVVRKLTAEGYMSHDIGIVASDVAKDFRTSDAMVAEGSDAPHGRMRSDGRGGRWCGGGNC